MTVVAATAIGTGIGEAQAGLSKAAHYDHARGEQCSHQQSSATMHGMHGIQEYLPSMQKAVISSPPSLDYLTACTLQ